MWAAENYGKRSFNIYQELSGLKNGIYLFRVRGGYRPFNDQHANQYNAILYANGNANYIQTLKEGMIPVEEAQAMTFSGVIAEEEPAPTMWEDMVWFLKGLLA